MLINEHLIECLLWSIILSPLFEITCLLYYSNVLLLSPSTDEEPGAQRRIGNLSKVTSSLWLSLHSWIWYHPASLLFRAASFMPGIGPATRTWETGSWTMSHQPLGQNRIWFLYHDLRASSSPEGPEARLPVLSLCCNFPWGSLKCHSSFQTEGAFLLWGLSWQGINGSGVRLYKRYKNVFQVLGPLPPFIF